MKILHDAVFFSVSLIALFLLQACSSQPDFEEEQVEYDIPEITPIPNSYGSIYGSGWTMSLFDDRRARQVGDIIIVRLEERMDASKKSSTATSKSHGLEVPNPTIFGKGVTHKGLSILENSLESEQSFDGSGSSEQSNSLRGSISVVVKRVLPNGTLVIAGEKWLTINQGKEFVKVKGIVRPADIETDNSILSWKIASASITYSAEGVLADANTMGWFGRFFQSIFSPF
ncbi:MAG: flagellar basal body L-ring protein FlgH [Pseudomonadales bacterium]|nr:flagellar basal body L-ring protein FlgH [Pseudomonadales bacterium]